MKVSGRVSRFGAVLAALLAVSACQPTLDGGRPAATLVEPPVPQTWVGVLPCADCPGIRTVLHLRADHRYLQRQTWLGRDSVDDSLVDVGRWRMRDDGGAVVLEGGLGATSQFALLPDGRLRQLDRHGEAIVSALPYELEPGSDGDAFVRPFPWRGTYVHSGGSGVFRDCGSGLELPVASGDAAAQLVRAYAGLRSGPGAELLFTLRGHLVSGPAADGVGTEEMLRVTEVDRAWPDEQCASVAAPPPLAGLEDTVWWLRELDGVHLAAAGTDSPRLRLLPASARVEAFGGCNALFGSYEAAGSALAFTGVARTRKRCQAEEAAELRLLEVLAATNGYTLDAGVLTLLDGDRPLARFGTTPR